MKTKNKFSMNKMYWFVVPALTLYTVFWLVPLIITFYLSFTNSTGMGNNYDFIGLKNYKYIIEDGTLVNALKNTMIYAAVYVIGSNLLALSIALILNVKLKLKSVYRALFYLPSLFSAIVVGFIWSYVYMPNYGLLSNILQTVGVNYEPNLLGKTSTALISIILIEIWRGAGLLMIIYLSGLQTISNDVLEAGKIDGCTGWQLIQKIKIPLLAPSITINVVLGIINGLKAFDYSYVVTQGGPAKSTQTLIYTVFRMSFSENLFGKGSALAVLSFTFIVIMVGIMLKIMKAREVEI